LRIAPFIGLRFLRSPRQSRSITVVTWVSAVGVMLGVTALIVTISVMNGFRENLFLAVNGTMAHARVTPVERLLKGPAGEELARRLEALPQVEATAPYFSRQAFLRAGESYRAVILRGIDPAREEMVAPLGHFLRGNPLLEQLQQEGTDPAGDGTASQPPPEGDTGELTGRVPLRELLAFPPPRGERAGIILGSALADALEVFPGDEVEVVSTVQRLTPIGPVPLIKRFKVGAVLVTGLGAVDEVMAYVPLTLAQRLHRAGDATGGVSLRVSDPYDIDTGSLLAALPPGPPEYRLTTWSEENRNIFQVMKLEKLGIFIVLTLIILVAFFNIIASLIMLVLEKRKAIAVLMSLGAPNSLVRRIFFMQGVWIGAVGTLGGLSLGLAACWALATFDLVPLPPGVFPLARHLPVRVEWSDLTLITGSSFLICLLVTLYPASAAARTNPVENLRGD